MIVSAPVLLTSNRDAAVRSDEYGQHLYLSVLNMLLTILFHHFTACGLIQKYEYSK